MTYYLCKINQWRGISNSSLLSFILILSFSTQVEFIKIYIGQLPLNIEQQHLREILEPLAEIIEVRIVKGDNTRGRFDLFCYAFVTMKGNEEFAYDLIKLLQARFPGWKMNVKNENDRQRNPKFAQGYPPPLSYPPQQIMPFQQSHYPSYTPTNQNANTNSSNFPSFSEKIEGAKPCRIFVRQLWVGGIPELYDKATLGQIMSQYGIVEEIEQFPKFAFVKFKQVSEATTAFERAEEIYYKFGNPPGFRIFFSDPTRRAYIVSNHNQYERQSPSTPILFLGYHPITSATVQLSVLRPVCEKYGKITNQYIRKNTNSQNRSYVLFTYSDIKAAIKAKQELNRRKDLLGDKRVQVALLLDENVILKNRDLSHTEKMFQEPSKKANFFPTRVPQPDYQYNYPYMPFYQPPYFDQNFYRPINEGENYSQSKYQGQQFSQQDIDRTINQILNGTSSKTEEKIQQKPQKAQELSHSDFISELLGLNFPIDKKESKEQPKPSKQSESQSQGKEPVWSGFLSWKGSNRVSVDGHSKTIQMQDYAINVISFIQFKDIYLKQESYMVLEPSNKISSSKFNQYIKHIDNRVGLAMNSKYLMYILTKTPQSDELYPINEDELLVIFQKASTITQIKDKLIKCDEIP